jgi:hypothetical protein
MATVRHNWTQISFRSVGKKNGSSGQQFDPMPVISLPTRQGRYANSNSLSGGQRRSIQRVKSSRRYRMLPPTSTARGSLPAARRRSIVATLTPINFAACWRDKSSGTTSSVIEAPPHVGNPPQAIPRPRTLAIGPCRRFATGLASASTSRVS